MVQPNTAKHNSNTVDVYDNAENSVTHRLTDVLRFSTPSQMIQRKTGQRDDDTREWLDTPDTKPFLYFTILWSIFKNNNAAF